MSKSRNKGTAFETSLLPALEPYWPDVIRNPAQGAADCGDFFMAGNQLYVVEAKNGARLALPEWWDETLAEARNAQVPFGVLVHKRKGKTDPEEQWATMTFGKWLELVHRSNRTSSG